ncbi:DNA cytosine methyltransferase [Paenibacillus glycanilyticus]|uniref:DNA cytosine methyltransferase n=1 Tax=Paenibacillus glycanilyticus TaxID=126569 RepID=UPI003EBF7F78
MKQLKQKPTVLSMFCGCGGLDLGFHQNGYDVVWANDINEDACLTYEQNLGTVVRGNIEDLEMPNIEDLDVLLSGFPCQSFSNAGNRKGINEKRGNLYKFTLKYIKELRPKVVVMENVRGLLSTKTESGYLLPEICESLSSLNYEVHFNLINASHYGVPQNRLRVLVVAINKDAQIGNFHFPEPIRDTELTLEKTIFDIPEDTPNQDEILRLNPQAIYLGSFVPEGGSWKDIPTEVLPDRLKRIRDNMEKYRWPNFYRRFRRDEVAGTITAAFKPENAGVWHPVENRVFTAREIARIQSFPDDFIFCGRSVKANYEMIGNAVPPKLSYVFAKSIKEILKGENLPQREPVRYFSQIKYGTTPIKVGGPEIIFDKNVQNEEHVEYEQLDLLSVIGE